MYFVYKAVIFLVVLYGCETLSCTRKIVTECVWEKNVEGNIWT